MKKSSTGQRTSEKISGNIFIFKKIAKYIFIKKRKKKRKHKFRFKNNICEFKNQI